MIIFKNWRVKKYEVTIKECEGWFLFGLIPLYVKEYIR
jgi:hypothetical protein